MNLWAGGTFLFPAESLYIQLNTVAHLKTFRSSSKCLRKDINSNNIIQWKDSCILYPETEDS